MSSYVTHLNHSISMEIRSSISARYKRITKAINSVFWDSMSDTAHSRYVGSYGRGTAINTSDLDVLIELPDSEFEHFSSTNGNGPSRLLQAVKDAILETYPKTDIKGDGQVVVVNFSDDMKFEILPAFKNIDYLGQWDGTYKYPDTHMGGNWMTTNPKAEQEAMAYKNSAECSNGLLFDTCKHIRYIRSTNFSSMHLSGILIDSFVYDAIKEWHWGREGEEESGSEQGTYEKKLLEYYTGNFPYPTLFEPVIYAPGSRMKVGVADWEVLGKVLNKMVG